MTPHLAPHQSLVLYDGECAFCDASVLYIIDRDPEGHFLFAPLQSEVGQAVLREHAPKVESGELDSIVLFDGERTYTQSTAALRIARRLRGPVRLVVAFFAIPRVVRDFFYRAFARRRIRWFGALTECRIPTPELRSRFLA